LKMRNLVAFGCGLIFGLGLIVSGMANPAKVLNFLDIFGHWDPSLLLVMASAIPVAYIGFRLANRMRKPVFNDVFSSRPSTELDNKLIIGAGLFGVGWGLAGACPGPAVVLVSAGSLSAALFFLAMVAGMVTARMVMAGQTNRKPVPTS
jgi:uncharacterized membrane protein YedE/YeeE